MAPSKHKRAHGQVAAQAVVIETMSLPPQTSVWDEDFEDDNKENEPLVDMVDHELAGDQDEAGVMDEGKDAHNQATVNSVRGQATILAQEMGLLLTLNEEKVALELFPKVFCTKFYSFLS